MSTCVTTGTYANCVRPHFSFFFSPKPWSHDAWRLKYKNAQKLTRDGPSFSHDWGTHNTLGTRAFVSLLLNLPWCRTLLSYHFQQPVQLNNIFHLKHHVTERYIWPSTTCSSHAACWISTSTACPISNSTMCVIQAKCPTFTLPTWHAPPWPIYCTHATHPATQHAPLLTRFRTYQKQHVLPSWLRKPRSVLHETQKEHSIRPSLFFYSTGFSPLESGDFRVVFGNNKSLARRVWGGNPSTP